MITVNVRNINILFEFIRPHNSVSYFDKKKLYHVFGENKTKFSDV